MTRGRPLEAHLRRRIEIEGPLTVAAFMAEALGNPRYGYYMHRDPFGEAGDFTTAPEISQMFGELIGLWCAGVWQAMGAPRPMRLVELGPGRGTLMADALRALRNLPEVSSAISVHLVETSLSLRARQKSALADEHGAAIEWHDDFAGVPPGPMILVANEFFDALPVHQLVHGAGGWHERLVDRADAGFRFAIAPHPSPLAVLLAPDVAAAPEGSIAEVAPAAISLANAIAARLRHEGGAALIIDYGPGRSAPGETLQAVRRHIAADVLADVGMADLTAHVDFQMLARSAIDAGAIVRGPVPQGAFLARLGIGLRMRALLEKASAKQRDDIESGARRLIDPAQMGTLFKAMALTHPELPCPEGFCG